MFSITLDSITIKQDKEGRFCLNDLHKAAGGESKHQPTFFMANQQTQELVDQLCQEHVNSGNSKSLVPFSKITGRSGGTFVVRELVFAYAM